MSVDTDESPAWSDEYRTKLDELRADAEAAAVEAAAAEEKAVLAAAAASAAEEEIVAAKAAEKKAAEDERIANRPLTYILVRHMGRSPRTRTLRAGRAGHRRQGVVLDDGTRIRKKGKKRMTQVDLAAVVDNHAHLLELILVGTIEVCDPYTGNAMQYDDVVGVIESYARHRVHTAEGMIRDYAEAMYVYRDGMVEYREDKAAFDKAIEEGEEPAELYPAPVKPNELPAWVHTVSDVVRQPRLQQDLPLGSNEYNTAPEGDTPEMPSAAEVQAAVDKDEASRDDDLGDDDSGTADPGEGETGADDPREGDPEAVTSGEGESSETGDHTDQETGDTELSPPPDGVEDGLDGGDGEVTIYTKEQLLDMKLEDLKEIAINAYGCDERVRKFRSKKDVVSAIFAALDKG